MDYFSPLPAELRLMIAEKCDKPSRLSLAQVSTCFRELAQRSLYCEIDQVFKEPEGMRATEYPGQRQTPWIQLLLRTIMERPELSRYVRKVCWTVHSTWDEDPSSLMELEQNIERDKAEIDPELVEMGLKIRKRSPFFAREWNWESTWDAALFEGNVDAMTALVLVQFDLLVSLELAPELIYRSRFLGPMFQCLASPIPEYNHFRHLRHVAFCERGNRHVAGNLDATISERIAILRTQRIETLELTLHDSHLRVLIHDLLTTHRYLTTLRLWFCNLGTCPIGRILDFTPALKVLQCGFLRFSADLDPFSKLDFAAFTLDLGRVSSTLEELTINFAWFHLDECSQFWFPSFTGTSFGSLQFLHRLSHLKVPVEMLMGPRPWNGSLLPHLLPPSLQSLVLVDAFPFPYHNAFMKNRSILHTINQVTAYLEGRSRHAPYLRKVTLKNMVPTSAFAGVKSLDDRQDYISYEMISDLSQAAKASGVAIEILFVDSLGPSEDGILWQHNLVA